MSEVSSPERMNSVSALQIRLEAVPENVMLVRRAVDGAAHTLGASDEVIDDLKLAVTEGCSNVVKYAYRGRPGELEVALDPLSDGFIVTIADHGSWLEPDDGDQAGGGLGIPLMEAVTRSFTIVSDGTGTRLTLEFDLERGDPRVDPAPDPGAGE
ncbi:MAG: ATP-binding protein [Solirubrobacterales bacterium]